MSTRALLIDTYLRSSWLRPESQILDEPDWFQVRTPSATSGMLNSVRRAILQPDQVDSRVAEVLADHASRRATVHWTVSELCRPLDLSERLIAHGFTRTGRTDGMFRDTSPLPMPAGVTVQEIGPEGLEDYLTVAVRGWSLDAVAGEETRRDLARSLADPNDALSYYVARVDGEPAGAGVLKQMPGRGYLLGSSVTPQARGRGAYRALVSARLAALAAEHVPLATIVALEQTSAPICRRLGFETVCRFDHLKWSLPPASDTAQA